MTPTRARLPNRRPSHVETLEVGGQVITACISFDPATDRPVSPIGAALDLLIAHEPRPDGEPADE